MRLATWSLLPTVVHVLLLEDGRTSVDTLLNREYAPAQGLEYQQVDAQERGNVCILS